MEPTVDVFQASIVACLTHAEHWSHLSNVSLTITALGITSFQIKYFLFKPQYGLCRNNVIENRAHYLVRSVLSPLSAWKISFQIDFLELI